MASESTRKTATGAGVFGVNHALPKAKVFKNKKVRSSLRVTKMDEDDAMHTFTASMERQTSDLTSSMDLQTPGGANMAKVTTLDPLPYVMLDDDLEAITGDDPSLSSSGQVITQEALLHFVAKHNEVVQNIFSEHIKQNNDRLQLTMRKITEHTETLLKQTGAPLTDVAPSYEDAISNLKTKLTKRKVTEHTETLVKQTGAPLAGVASTSSSPKGPTVVRSSPKGPTVVPEEAPSTVIVEDTSVRFDLGPPQSDLESAAAKRTPARASMDSSSSGEAGPAMVAIPSIVKARRAITKKGTQDNLVKVGARTSWGRGSISSLASVEKPNDKAMLHKGVFVDERNMKERAREKGMEPSYNVCDFYKETGLCQLVARSHQFEMLSLAVISLNAVWMGYDIDANDAVVAKDADPIFIVADNFFCVYFTVEWFLRFGAFERKLDGLQDAWFVFDGTLMFMMAVETWVLPVILAAAQTGLGDASLIKMLRLAKIVRLMRLARVLKEVPELLIVVKGIGVAARAVVCTFFLLLFIVYLFAIVMRQASDGTDMGNRLYPNVPRAMRYLLTLGVAPDLMDPVEEAVEAGFFFAILFSFFIGIIVITVMNMLVGILVGVMQAVASVEQEEMLVAFVKENLTNILSGNERGVEKIADIDDEACMGKVEFEQLLDVPQAKMCFKQMDVDCTGLAELTDFMFAGDRKIGFSDFMAMILQLRGSNHATVKDIVDLRHFMVITLSELYEVIEGFNQHDSESLDVIVENEPSVDNQKSSRTTMWGMGCGSLAANSLH